MRCLGLALAILALTSAYEYDMLDHADSNQDSQYMSPHSSPQLLPNPYANLRPLEQQEEEGAAYSKRAGNAPEERANKISIPMYGGGSGYGGGQSAGIITLSSSSSASVIPTAQGSGHGLGYGGAGYGGGYGGGHGSGYGSGGHGGGFQHGPEGLLHHGGNVLKGPTPFKGYGGYNREEYGSISRSDNVRDSGSSSSERVAEAARYQNLLNYYKAQRNANAPGYPSIRNEDTPSYPSSNSPSGPRYSPKPDYQSSRPSPRPYSGDSESPKYPTRQVPSYSADTRPSSENDKYPPKYVRNYNEDTSEVLKKIKQGSGSAYKTRPRV